MTLHEPGKPRLRSGGRPRLPGARYPSGNLKPVADLGTPEMRARKAAEAVAQAEATIGKPSDVWRRYAYVPLDVMTDRLLTPAQMIEMDRARIAEGREPKFRNFDQRMAAARALAEHGRAVLKQQDLDDGREYLIRRTNL